MTSNQIAYSKAQEDKRHNKAMESLERKKQRLSESQLEETQRSNIARESEMSRSNRAQEELKRFNNVILADHYNAQDALAPLKLQEEVRSNMAREDENVRSNKAKESHNTATLDKSYYDTRVSAASKANSWLGYFASVRDAVDTAALKSREAGSKAMERIRSSATNKLESSADNVAAQYLASVNPVVGYPIYNYGSE